MEARSGTCFNCRQPGHVARACPANQPQDKPAAKTLDDAEISGRIVRFHIPASETEMRGLIETWRRGYQPGIEYPEAPRYPPGFVAVLRARQMARRAD